MAHPSFFPPSPPPLLPFFLPLSLLPSLLSPPFCLYVCVHQSLSVEYLSRGTYGVSAGKHRQLKTLEEGKKSTLLFLIIKAVPLSVQVWSCVPRKTALGWFLGVLTSLPLLLSPMRISRPRGCPRPPPTVYPVWSRPLPT